MINSSRPWARIVIVAFNSGHVLQKCIDHLSNQTDSDFEVTIVDNLSTDGSVDSLVLPDERFSVLCSSENLGFAGGSNLGIQGANTEWVFTLNPDAWVEKDWLEKCKLAIKRNPQCTMLSPFLLQVSPPNLIDGCGDVLSIFGHSWRGGHMQPSETAPHEYCQVFSPCGACAGYRRDIFLKASGFDDTFFCYKEDVDLGLRLNRMGEKCVFVPNAIVYHIGSSTLGERHPFILYHSHRNTIFMIAKNFPILNLIIALPAYPLSVIWIMLRNLHLSNNVHILKGVADGLFLLPVLLFKRLIKKISPNRRATQFYVSMRWSRNALKKHQISAWKL